jgi:hypothetical protein
MAIKTSLGTPTANSYVSVASADEYLNSRENADAWTNLTSTALGGTTAQRQEKENKLIQATREIDFNMRFNSKKYNQGIRGQDDYQNLEFPRWGNQDANSDLFLPDEVKYGTYEQALWILERGGLKTVPEGQPIERMIIGTDTRRFFDPWINRQVTPTGKWSWQGSRF